MADSELNSTLFIEQTKEWVNKLVVGLNFCPFAKREVQRNSIRYVPCPQKKQKAVLSLLQAEIEHLNQHSKTETTLIVLTNGFNHFFDYLDLVDVAQQWLEENDYVGIYQIASFHPEYVFEGESIDSAANYTNRSPHPTLHLLREQSLERAIKSYKHPEQIPEDNIDKAHSMGKAELKALLASCMKI